MVCILIETTTKFFYEVMHYLNLDGAHIRIELPSHTIKIKNKLGTNMFSRNVFEQPSLI